MYNVQRPEEEINRVMNWADEGVNNGSHYAGMSYEQGILDALNWLFGDDDHAPDEE